ncbi:unnamed protein product [marine sediment metagenome]|uniref:Uncharacterized protein n=1 Tax=marine sediment metagenome TaxID=412755 RepID=X1ADN1_9ZZZZ
MIKTFRGLIADSTQDTIVLHTNDGSMGYRIVKFELISNNPQAGNQESVIKIYKISQTTIDGLIDFSDNTLLGVGVFKNYGGVDYNINDQVIFDKEIFNQDIYITHTDTAGSTLACNYYIELEQIKLDLSENTVATLKDIRNELRIPPG